MQGFGPGVADHPACTDHVEVKNDLIAEGRRLKKDQLTGLPVPGVHGTQADSLLRHKLCLGVLWAQEADLVEQDPFLPLGGEVDYQRPDPIRRLFHQHTFPLRGLVAADFQVAAQWDIVVVLIVAQTGTVLGEVHPALLPELDEKCSGVLIEVLFLRT